MKPSRSLTLALLLSSLLSCRPVLTIGWTEIVILAVLLLILAGPSIWRFYQWYRKYKESEKE
ncbi:MAG: hypothetical protein GY755_05955 [Chloroflexi bacterium]|nr:hypothetical protein [Chloroflexota bacterium]